MLPFDGPLGGRRRGRPNVDGRRGPQRRRGDAGLRGVHRDPDYLPIHAIKHKPAGRGKQARRQVDGQNEHAQVRLKTNNNNKKKRQKKVSSWHAERGSRSTPQQEATPTATYTKEPVSRAPVHARTHGVELLRQSLHELLRLQVPHAGLLVLLRARHHPAAPRSEERAEGAQLAVGVACFAAVSFSVVLSCGGDET
jgi:hypothetical protein